MLLGLALLSSAAPSAVTAFPVHNLSHGAGPSVPAGGFTIPCELTFDCPDRNGPRRPPGPADRDVRPFEGTLGRPCAYRWRYAPSGPRRVRVCF